MALRWKRETLAVVVLAVGVLTAWVLRTPSKPPTLEIRVAKIRDDESTFHWRWAFTSERHWETFHSTDRDGARVIVLEPAPDRAGPVSRLSPLARGPRSRTLTYEVVARRNAIITAPRLTGYTLSIRMRGNNGGTPASSVTSGGQVPDGEWSKRFKALRTAGGRLDLPARVPLAVVDGQTQVLEFP